MKTNRDIEDLASFAQLLVRFRHTAPNFDQVAQAVDDCAPLMRATLGDTLGAKLELARRVIPAGAAPVIAGKTFARTIWTCTTDGNNRSVTTTVHATAADAYARVRADLAEDCPAHQLKHLQAIADADLVPAWEGYCDGACIIEPHNIEVEA